MVMCSIEGCQEETGITVSNATSLRNKLFQIEECMRLTTNIENSLWTIAAVQTLLNLCRLHIIDVNVSIEGFIQSGRCRKLFNKAFCAVQCKTYIFLLLAFCIPHCYPQAADALQT